MSNPLTDVLPGRVRLYAYAVAFVLSAAVTAYEAANGDWRAAVLPFLTTLTSALSASNVSR